MWTAIANAFQWVWTQFQAWTSNPNRVDAYEVATKSFQLAEQSMEHSMQAQDKAMKKINELHEEQLRSEREISGLKSKVAQVEKSEQECLRRQERLNQKIEALRAELKRGQK